MKDRILRRLTDECKQERLRAAEIAEARREAAFGVPAVSEAQRAYVKALHSVLLKGGSPDNDELRVLKRSYEEVLAKYGYKESDFEPAPPCPICGGKGITPDGKVCACIRDAFICELGVACDVDPSGFCLDDFDESSVADKVQARALKKVYGFMSDYAAKFPSVTRRVLVLSGKTGTGKTYLASALARTLINKGYGALFMSAVRFNSLMLKCHTSPYSERDRILYDVMHADMLIIDDLASEPHYKNVTCEYLLLILEERSAKGLSTVITTNLTAEEILSAYNERIYSRMCDKRAALFLTFGGNDLRLA